MFYITGGINGSLTTLMPVRDAVYKRLQTLERQLQRFGGNFAGLNVRGFRTVRNERVSRPLTKGLLDGTLLSEFETLHALRQAELAKQAATDADTVNLNLANVRSPF